MKKRSTGRRHNSKSGLRKGLPFGLQPTRKQRKSWVFERLEDRCMFSGTPADPTAAGQWVAISSATPQGRSLIAQYEAAGIQEITLGASQLTATAASTGANDPDFGFQWNLFNAGQLVEVGQVQAIFGKPGEDINVIPAWRRDTRGKACSWRLWILGCKWTTPTCRQISTRCTRMMRCRTTRIPRRRRLIRIWGYRRTTPTALPSRESLVPQRMGLVDKALRTARRLCQFA